MAGSSSIPSKASGKKVMHQQLVKGGTGNKIVRHINYTATDEKGLSAGQINANQINTSGEYRKYACASCLAAVQQFNKKQHLGRGSNSFNEYFSCITWAGKGIGGLQCSRCVGLGSGDKCCDPPEAVQKQVSALIKLVPAYNKALSKTKTQLYSDLTDAEKKSIDAAVAASIKFDLTWKGALKSGAAETPVKKRKFDAFQTPTKELSTLQQSANDARTDINSVSKQVKAVAGHVRFLADDVSELRKYLRASRERERWLVEALQGVVDHMNKSNADANSITNDAGQVVAPPPVVQVDNFDLTRCTFEDEDAEATESEDDDD